MRRLFVPVILFSFLFAAFERIPQSPLQIAAGFSYFVRDESPTSSLSHPASLVRINHRTTTLFYSLPFQLQELNHYGAYLAIPVKFFNVATGFSTFGNEIYRESIVSISIAQKIGDNMGFGVITNVQELSIKNYGASRTLGISASLDYKLSDFAQWSLVYHNLNAPKIGNSNELLPQVVATGITFSPTSYLTTVVEVKKDQEFDNRYKFGVQWQPISGLIIASGFVNQPSQITGGILFKIKNIQISYAIATHSELAISQVFALQFILP